MIALTLLLHLAAADTVAYAKPDTWLCRPGRQDACAVDLSATVVGPDGSMHREVPPAAGSPPAIDCFYVYPTVSRDSGTYSDMQAGEEELNVVRQQFAGLRNVCRPYAPLYRQMTLAGLGAMMRGALPNGRLDRGPAYQDVLAAWRHYLANDNQGRGVVLVGHSQGAMLLTTLVAEEIDGKPLQSRLVSAVLLGTAIPVAKGKDVGGAFRSVPTCRSASQTGCLISFGAFRSTVPPAANAYFGRVRGDSLEAACTNPAALGGGRAPVDAWLTGKGSLITGGPRAHAWVKGGPEVETPFVRAPGLLSAACISDDKGSRLDVVVHGVPADARADDIPGDIGAGTPAQGQWGLHLLDANLVMGDLVRVVGHQATAWARRASIPRTASGRPDMNGIWQAMGNANYDIEPHNASAAMAWRPGPVVPVPAKEVVALGAIGSVPSGQGIVVGNTIPYTPEALKKRQENRDQWLARDPEIRCYLPGVPRAHYMPYPFQVFQSDRKVFMAYEYAGAVRDIYLKDPGPPQVDSWMGQSVGRWDGDSFVTEVTGFNDGTWFDRAGNHHSEQMKVTERFTMTDADHMRYEATIEDPRTFTRPWMIRTTLYRNIDPEARLGQFKCVPFVEELLYGHLRKNPLKP